MKKTFAGPTRLQQKFARLQRSLALIGYISDGSVLDRSRLKQPRSGYQWTRKVGRKTVTVALSREQFLELKKAVDNGRHLRKTIRQMEALSRQIVFRTTRDTQRFKPLRIKVLA